MIKEKIGLKQLKNLMSWDIMKYEPFEYNGFIFYIICIPDSMLIGYTLQAVVQDKKSKNFSAIISNIHFFSRDRIEFDESFKNLLFRIFVGNDKQFYKNRGV